MYIYITLSLSVWSKNVFEKVDRFLTSTVELSLVV